MGTLEEAIVAYFRPYSRLDSVSRCRVAKFTRLCATVCGAFDCNTGSNYCPEGVARRSYNFPRVGGCTFFLFLFQYKSHACFLSFSLSFLPFVEAVLLPFSLTPRLIDLIGKFEPRIIEGLKFPTELVLAIILASIFNSPLQAVFLLLCFIFTVFLKAQ